MADPTKAEIEAQVQAAKAVIERFDYKMPACVFKLWVSPRRFVLGFNFQRGVAVGDEWMTDDGTRCEAVAIVVAEVA